MKQEIKQNGNDFKATKCWVTPAVNVFKFEETDVITASDNSWDVTIGDVDDWGITK